MEFDRLSIVLLVLGEDPPDLTEEAEAALQDAHMAYIADLHQAHLVAAGPLRDPGAYYRGLCIMTVGVEEARTLAEADPAVRAGKFRAIVLPWMVPGGALQFSPAKFPRSVAEATS